MAVKSLLGNACLILTGLIRHLVYTLGIASGITLMLIMGLICSEVFCRYALNRPILGTVEISEHMLVFIVFAGLAYTQSVGGHIKIEVVTRHLPPRAQHILRIIALVIALLIFATIAWRTGQAAWESWQIKEVRWGALPLPTWPVKFAVPVGSLLLCLQLIIDLVAETRQRFLGVKFGEGSPWTP